MKTVNFIEALEANKTKRVRRGDSLTTKYSWFDVSVLRDCLNLNVGHFESQWHVEEKPEEIWVVKWDCGYSIYTTRDSALAHNSDDTKIRKFREVIE